MLGGFLVSKPMMHRAIGHVVWQKTQTGRIKCKQSIMTTKEKNIELLEGDHTQTVVEIH